MNIRTLVMLGALVLPVSAVAQSNDFVAGQVTKVDESAGKITIKHGPLKKFDMDEGMTMVFRAGDPAMLKTVKAATKSVSFLTGSTASSRLPRSKGPSNEAGGLARLQALRRLCHFSHGTIRCNTPSLRAT